MCGLILIVSMPSQLLHGTLMYEVFKRYSRDGLLTIHIGSMIITLIGDRKYVKETFVQDEANYRHPILLDIFLKAF